MTTMASLLGFYSTWLVITTVAPMNGLVNGDRVFEVGDEFGWQEPPRNSGELYARWATSNRFQVGDSLSFKYENDSVIEVDKWGYYHCDPTNPIAALNNGSSSVFKLDKSGAFYFISGTADHCKNGQRLLIEVMGLHHHIHSPPPRYLPPSPQPGSGVSPTLGSLSSSVLMATLAALFSSIPFLF